MNENHAELHTYSREGLHSTVITKQFDSPGERDSWVDNVLENGYTREVNGKVQYWPKWAIWNVITWDER